MFRTASQGVVISEELLLQTGRNLMNMSEQTK